MNKVTSEFQTEKVYCEVGHVYLDVEDNEHYICARVTSNGCALICLEDGFRWSDPDTDIELPHNFVEVHGTVTMEVP